MSQRMLLLCVTVFAFFTSFATPQAQTPAPFRVYLAYEDGPTDAYTPQILDILAQYGAHASFVIAGAQIAGHETILQRELREGHALINHLWKEPNVYAGAAADVVIASYVQTEEAIRNALGDMLPVYDAQTKMFWQPGGAAQPFPQTDGISVITYNWQVNSDDCGWTIPRDFDLDTFDFDRAVLANVLGEPISDGMVYNAYDYGDGVIIIFHDLNRVTGRVLPTILAELQSAGAQFEALPRPWDAVNTMPIVLGVPPQASPGYEGYTISGTIRETANLRDLPSLEGRILQVLPTNTVVTAIGRAGSWIEVTYEGQTAWISRSLLTLRGAIPNLPQKLSGN